MRRPARRDAGLSRYRIAAGERAMPVHVHADDEELFYVLDGEGVSWQDGRTYAVRAGDCILHRPGAEAHTIVGAGDGLDVLAFGGGSATGLTWLPRAPGVVERPALAAPRRAEPVRRRGGGRARSRCPRPRRSARRRSSRSTTLPAEDFTGGGDVVAVRRDSATCSGRRAPAWATSSSRRARSAARRTATPPRRSSSSCSTATGTLLLGDEEHPVRAGSVVARPPGTGVPHAFRAGDDGPLTLLAFGTREPNDIVFFPRSGKVGLRGIKVRFLVAAGRVLGR